VGLIHEQEHREYEEEPSNEGCEDAEDFMAYSHKVHNEELLIFNAADMQFDQLKGEVQAQQGTRTTTYNHPSNNTLICHGDDKDKEDNVGMNGNEDSE